jgi:tetratricopeptide (TPR) repeat protein
LLEEEEAAILARCAVFQGGFGTAAALTVVGADEDALAGLAAKSLLRRPAAGRYEMHELLRQFALEKLGKDEVYARHSAYYLDWVLQQEEALRGRQARRTIAAIHRDWGNLLLAWRWASRQGQPEVIRRGSRVLATVTQLSSMLREGADLFARTAADLEVLLAERADPELHLTLAAVLVEQAGLLNAQGWSEQAVAVSRQATNLAQQSQVAELEARAHLQRSIALFRQLDYAGARHSGRLARALAWEAGSRRVEADSHLILGQVEHATGDYGVAQVYYERAFQLYRQVDHPRGEGVALMQLGALASAQADFAAAHRHYGRAREIFHDVVDRRQEGVVLDSLGQVAAQEGDYADAWDYDQQALAILREVGDNRAVGSVLTNMGALLLSMGQYERARAVYEQAQRLWREIGYRQGEARVLTGLACVTGRPGDYVAAEELARRSLAIAEESGERSEQARALNCLGRALTGQGRWEDAAGSYWAALAQRRELGEQAAAIESLAGLARVALARGDLAQAQAHVVEVLAYLEKAGSFHGTDDDLGIYLICCQVLEAVGDVRARKALATAHRLLEERAARIEGPEFRRSFLEEVVVNREIARLYLEVTE